MMTEDERILFDDWLPVGANETFRLSMLGYAKSINEAIRTNVIFGDPIHSGQIEDSVVTMIQDTTKEFTDNELAGFKLVVTSPGALMNQERTIVSNTATTITLETEFDSDPTGMEYAIMIETKDSIVFYLDLPLAWNYNLCPSLDVEVRNSLTKQIIKNWFLTNRLNEDYSIEDSKHIKALENIRGLLHRRVSPVRRSADMFGGPP